MANCGICGEPMPPNEEMFKFHGYSGPCPKPPLPKPPAPYVMERHDMGDGSISYEVWDRRPGTYRRLCTLNENLDGGSEDERGRDLYTARQDAEMIVRALNNEARRNELPPGVPDPSLPANKE